MPLYVYECPKCQEQREELQREPKAPTCDSCKKKMKRVLADTAKPQLRGSMVHVYPWRTRRGRGY